MKGLNLKHNHVKYLFFDLDDTLCNYKQARANARVKINQLLLENKMQAEVFWKGFKQAESELMNQFLQNHLSKPEYRFRRFYDVLKQFLDNSSELAEKLNHIFMSEGNSNIQLFADVKPFLKRCVDQGIQLAILTNGPADGQRIKIKNLALENYIDKIYISEEVGSSKPDEKYFLHVLKDLKIQPDQSVMIGDSVRHDYVGCKSVGIPFILIERFEKNPEFEGIRVQSLTELNELLNAFTSR